MMSPSLQGGTVHVERYLGSNLLANQSRPARAQKYDPPNGHGPPFKGPLQNMPQTYYSNGYMGRPQIQRPVQHVQQNEWAGVPLISIVNNRRSKKTFSNGSNHSILTPTQHVDARRIELNNGQNIPLSKLALQTQGAPLIIQGRYNQQRRIGQNYYNAKSFYQSNNNRSFKNVELVNNKTDDCFIKNKGMSQDCNANNIRNTAVSNIDTASVASDESSNSINSESCLPRIIKPRKRRKKDRKPNNPGPQSEVLSRKFEAVGDGYIPNIRSINNYYPLGYDVNKFHSRPNNNYMQHNYNTIVCNSQNIPPNLQIESRVCENTISSVCQCRYCDPSGHIWEIDSFGFSELFDENSAADFAPTKLAESMKAVGSNNRKPTDNSDREITLRRSWSDPQSSHTQLKSDFTGESDIYSTKSTPNLFYSLFSNSAYGHELTLGNIFGIGYKNKNSDSNMSNQVVPDLILDTSNSPRQSLEISSQINISSEGQIDSEINFYSPTLSPVASKNESPSSSVILNGLGKSVTDTRVTKPETNSTRVSNESPQKLSAEKLIQPNSLSDDNLKLESEFSAAVT